MDPAVSSALLLSVTTGIGTFGTLLPDLSEVRKADLSDTDMVRDVRLGEVAAGSLVVGIGFVGSVVTDSPLPLVASVVSVLILVFMYESVLTNGRIGATHVR